MAKKTSSKLSKIAAQVPQTEAELAAMLQATVEAQTKMETAIAERDQKINAARAQIETESGYDATIAEQEKIIARNMELIETWSVMNKKTRFGKAKSTTISGVRLGWRLGNWATELKPKVRWAGVVMFLQDLVEAGKEALAKMEENESPTPKLLKIIARGHQAAEYLRIKTEADKNNMLRDRENRATRALLKKAGVLFTQEETFYLDPEREGQQPPRLEAA